ncbi:hypothetical protein DC083_08840 [Ignatzschineria ureiclastica]|uniref:histidine kinase n=1 Tax=Ignatzschineria ureiclastica TaxID=472582 RepID=A0A2U2ACN4_9GAMM|nr:ATP-binding protein [Ignatzschineria ureiclastica]PWD80413.1 hypothetical protein DC083_08840 [Ignatzschineria ureiclastica]GGZ99686.1 two-component sensor histidine kinase [Ignatzschineria ureiclastica]
MSLKRRLMLLFSLILLVSGVIIIGLVGYETSEQMDILTDTILTDSEKIQEMQHEIQEILVAISIFVGVVLLGALLMIRYVTNQFLTPFVNLVAQLSERGSLNLTPIIIESRSKEVNLIAGKINHLLSNISQRIDHEKQFTADVAHELRTPLAGMRLTLELMDDLPEKPLLIARIDELLITIERLLQFARASHELHSDQVAELSFYQEVIQPLQNEYRDNFPHPIIWNIPADLKVRGDASLLYLLLKNLLDNVQFYAGQGENTEVLAQKTATGIELIVEDRGPGMSEVQRLAMTERFQRADESRQGFGLGLNIVQKIVEAHQGSLRFDARLDGQPGLRVVVLLND